MRNPHQSVQKRQVENTMPQRSLIAKLIEVIDRQCAEREAELSQFQSKSADIRAWLPSRGNVLFTLVMITVLFWAQARSS